MNAPTKLSSELLKQLSIVAVIPLTLTALFFFWFLLPQIESNTSRHQQTLASSIAKQIKQHITSAEEQINILTNISEQVQTSNASHALITQHTSDNIDRFSKQNTYFDALYLLDASNNIIHINIHENEHGVLEQLYLGMDLSMSPIIAKRSKEGGNWSAVFLSIVTGRLSLAYVIPVNNLILVAEVALNRLPQLSQDLSLESQMVMILDERAQLIGHPNIELSQQQLNLSNLPFFKNNEADSKVITSDSFTWMGERYFGTLIPLDSPNWHILVSEKESSFSATIYNLLQYWLISNVCILLLALWAAFRRSRELSSRFLQLNKQAQSIMEGDYVLANVDTSIEEFQELSTNLDKMASAINKRERELSTQEQQLRSTLESVPSVAVQWYDDRGHVMYWNDASERIFGFSEEEAMGKRLDKLIFAPQPTAEFNIHLRRVQQKEHVSQEFELPFTNKKGEEGYVLVTLFSIPSSEHEEIYVCMAIDMTRQRRAEANIRRLNTELEKRVEERTEELRHANNELQITLSTLNETMDHLVQSEKLAALGGLVAGVAHELNTPIGNALIASTSLTDFAAKISAQNQSGKMTKSAFLKFIDDANTASDIAKRNLERASELISSFKQIATDQSSSHKRAFTVKELVEGILTTLQPMLRKTTVKIQTQIPEDFNMNSFPGPLGQTINNLIINSITHGLDQRDDGQIIISVSRDSTISDDSDEHITITIEDNGCGISPENISRIFDPFYTTRLGQGGSGLGLHIVHNLVTGVLAGQIQVQSKLNEGTRFSMTLPANAPSSDEEFQNASGS